MIWLRHWVKRDQQLLLNLSRVILFWPNNARNATFMQVLHTKFKFNLFLLLWRVWLVIGWIWSVKPVYSYWKLLRFDLVMHFESDSSFQRVKFIIYHFFNDRKNSVHFAAGNCARSSALKVRKKTMFFFTHSILKFMERSSWTTHKRETYLSRMKCRWYGVMISFLSLATNFRPMQILVLFSFLAYFYMFGSVFAHSQLKRQTRHVHSTFFDSNCDLFAFDRCRG